MKRQTLVSLLGSLFSTLFFVCSAAAQPVPELTISATDPLLLSDTVTIELSMENTSLTADDTGFYPLMEVVLPDGLECDNTCVSGISVTSLPGTSANVSKYGDYGTPSASYDNPVTGESITIQNNETLLVIVPPIGSLAVGQPAVTIEIPATLSAAAAVGTSEAINGRGIFALGTDPNGTIGDCGTGDTICDVVNPAATVTPQVAILSKTIVDDVAAATGPHYPRTFTIRVDVATGAQITVPTVADIIPDTMIVINPPGGDCTGGDISISPVPAACTYSEDGNGGASFTALFNTITGGSGNDDIEITYKAYVQEHVNGSGSDIVPAATGAGTTSNNSAAFNFDYAGNPQPQQTAQVTINQLSVDLSKSGSVTDDREAAGNSPGDIITWTITTYISDYFSFDALTIQDDIADGQTYVDNSLSVRIVEDSSDITRTQAQLEVNSRLTGLTKDGSGVTHFDLDLSNALVDAGADDVLVGDSSYSSPTRVIITYQTDVDDQFVDTYVGGNTDIVDGGDVIGNTTDISYQVLGTGNTQTPSASDSITIQPLTTVSKVVAFECDAGMSCNVPSGQPEVAPGESLVYRITAVIPTGDLENFTITDYLPAPFFDATDPDADGSSVEPGAFSEIAQGDTAPNPGEWRYMSTSYVPASESVTVEGDDNTLKFDFSDVIEDTGVSAARTIQVLFTIKATSEPMNDGLQLVNVTVAQHANSAQEDVIVTQAGSISLETDEPHIDITKEATTVITGTGSVSSGNFVNVDVDDELHFTVTLTNNGGATAYDIELSDTLPAASGLQQGTLGLNITDNCSFGTDNSSGDTLDLSDGTLAAGASCTVLYEAQVVAPARFGDVIPNTATVLWAGETGGTDYPSETDTANTTIRNPSISKNFAVHPTSSDPATTHPDTRPGEPVLVTLDIVVPEGQAKNFTIWDQDTSSGNPEGDFLQALDINDVSFEVGGSPVLTEQNCSLSGFGAYYNFVGDTTLCFANNMTLGANFVQSSSTRFEIRFGDLVNGDADDATAEQFRVILTVSPNADKPNGTYINRSTLRWQRTNNNTRSTTNNATFDIENPVLVISKTSPTPSTVSIGDTITYVIDVENTGIVTAYSVANIADTLPPGLVNPTLTAATYEGSNVLGAASLTGSVPNIEITVENLSSNPEIASNDNYIATFTADVGGTIVADTTDGPGHPGGVSEGPGCVISISNSADIASFKTGPLGGDPTATEITANAHSHTLDSDGDGVPNSAELASGPACRDSDGDGVNDHLDTDSDDNGVPDSTEYDGGKDTDGDGTPDFIDDDDDNDGTSDWDEINDAGGDPTDDTDGDTIPDWQDEDSDNDGIPDSIECGGIDPCPDSDGDGIENYRDLDSDHDGIPDIVEAGGTDSDGNGIADDLTDDDSDGLPDIYDGDDNRTGGVTDPLGTALTPPDTDSDTFVDYLDIDADDDGIVDNVEAQQEGSYVAPSGTDANSNGLDDIYEGAGALPRFDTDSDTTPDVLDDDSDDDNVPDTIEGHDANGDGVADTTPVGSDSDSDGLDDAFDTFDLTSPPGSGRNEVGSNSPLPNHDTDSIRDWRDTDDDGDGILTENEDPTTDSDPTNDDTDSNGTPNYLDPDSDGDTIPDATECTAGSCPNTDAAITDQLDLDSDSDGIPDSVEGSGDQDGDGIPNYRDLDADGDGIFDIIEAGGTDANGDGLLDDLADSDSDGLADLVDGTPLPTPDTDSDGLPDYLDIDADNDGIVDTIEALPEGTAPAFNDTDANTNGMDDAYEGVNAIAPVNIDGDSLPDYRDLDTDADGVGDLIEGHDDDADGVADVSPSGSDSDNDGLDDAFDIEDAASASDSENAVGTNAPLPDFDSDSTRDWRDVDDDDDGIPTLTEGEGDPDGDGKPNYKDLDSDADGASDEDEGTGDIDNDGTPDYLDPPTCTVTGSVQLPSGEGLSDVSITMTPGTFQAVTDAAGDFSIEEVGDGSYMLEAVLPEGASIATESVTANNGDCGAPVAINASWNLVSPVYFVWNGFVRQLNLVVLNNKGENPIRAIVTLYDINGTELHQERHWLDPKTEKDLLVNDMPGYAVDTYGFVQVEFDPEEGFDGYSVHYRLDTNLEQVEFAIIRPFETVRRGNTYALFNQINPSLDESQANNEMPSWVQVVNLDTQRKKEFTVRLYDTQGALITSYRMGIPPFGRRDANGGHQLPGIGGVGLIEIVPDDAASPYTAQLYHYSSDGLVAFLAPTYSYAIGDHARPGVKYTQYAPISNAAGGTNWVVAANTENSSARVVLEFLRNNGDEIGSQTISIGAKSQIHLRVSDFVNEAFSGVVRARTENDRKIIVKSYVYFHGDDLRVSAAYGVPGRGVFVGAKATGFNTYWQQQNWLKVFNVGGQSAAVTVKAYGLDGTLYGEAEAAIPAGQGRDLELQAQLGIALPQNTYGTLVVESSVQGAVFVELLRVKPGEASAPIDMGKSLPVR